MVLTPRARAVPTFAFLATFSSSGPGNGQFSRPFGVAVVPGGDVYVADSGNERVQVFGAIADAAVTASFSPSGVVVGQGSTVTLRLTKPNAIPTLTGVGTGVSLPAGLARAGTVTNNCGGTVLPSGATVSIAGVSLAPKASCELRIPATTQAAGSFKVTTEVTTSDQTAAGTAMASATLAVQALPTTTTTTTAAAVVPGLPSAPPSGPPAPSEAAPHHRDAGAGPHSSGRAAD